MVGLKQPATRLASATTNGGQRCDGDMQTVDEMAQRLLAELFASQVTSLEPSGTAPRALHPELFALEQACRPELGDYSALAPAKTLNHLLGRLVALLQGDGAVAPGHPSQQRTDRDRHMRAQAAQLAAARIRQCPDLQRQAHDIRRIAGVAEGQMERLYSARVCQRLNRTHGSPITRKGTTPLLRLRAAFSDFPYTDNYERLVRAELQLWAMPVTPLWPRLGDSTALPAIVMEALPRLCGAVHRALHTHSALPLAVRAWRRKTFAVCGSGPLPLTGLMLHVLTQADVVLIDNDARAVALSRKLVAALERHQVLRPGAVHVRFADAGELWFVPPADGPHQGSTVESGRRIPCHGLLLASLLPTTTKRRMFQRLRDTPMSHPMAVLVRSARGLTAELAYEAAPTAELSDLLTPFCGELWPDNQVPWFSKSPSDSTHHPMHTDQTQPLLYAPRDVINTCELFYRLPLPVADKRLQLSCISSSIEIESAVHLLYRSVGASQKTERDSPPFVPTATAQRVKA